MSARRKISQEVADEMLAALQHARTAMCRCSAWDPKQHSEVFEAVCAAIAKATGDAA